MIINYKTHTLVKGGKEVPEGESVVVNSRTTDVYMQTLSIALHYTYENEFWEFFLDTQEGVRLILSDPFGNPQNLMDTLDKHKLNFLEFPENFISHSLARPYGIGMEEGTVTRAPIQVIDIMDSLIDQYDLFFNPPKYIRNADSPVTAHFRKPFRRTFSEEVNLPIFCYNSFIENIKEGQDIVDAPSWASGEIVLKAFPYSKVSLVNNGFTEDPQGVKIRKWAASPPSAHHDAKTIASLKRQLFQVS